MSARKADGLDPCALCGLGRAARRGGAHPDLALLSQPPHPDACAGADLGLRPHPRRGRLSLRRGNGRLHAVPRLRQSTDRQARPDQGAARRARRRDHRRPVAPAAERRDAVRVELPRRHRLRSLGSGRKRCAAAPRPRASAQPHLLAEAGRRAARRRALRAHLAGPPRRGGPASRHDARGPDPFRDDPPRATGAPQGRCRARPRPIDGHLAAPVACQHARALPRHRQFGHAAAPHARGRLSRLRAGLALRLPRHLSE